MTLSNIHENKSHFNYTRFFKLLSLEGKQNESLFKVKTVLICEYSFTLYFENEGENIQMESRGTESEKGKKIELKAKNK